MKKSVRSKYGEMDRLPDELLIYILCRLSMKEAVKTSVLSRRWRYLWTHFNGSLDFDASYRIVPKKSQRYSSFLAPERIWFRNWVNRVLYSIRNPSIPELRICFDVGSDSDLDLWITFAIVEKQIRTLVLDPSNISFIPAKPYNFPTNLRSNYLSVLRLSYVRVNEQDIHNILYTYFPCLRKLSVWNSDSLIDLRLCDSNLKLDHLEIGRCNHLKEVVIYDMLNLVSFVYSGIVCDELWERGGLKLRNLPNLVHLSMGGFYCKNLSIGVVVFSRYLSRLHTLVLDFSITQHPPLVVPQLSNLKHLELRMMGDRSYLPVAPLLRAAPFLHGFTFKVFCRLLESKSRSREVQCVAEERPFQCLKVVRLEGFDGRTDDVEMAFYLVQNAVFLEKMTVDPLTPLSLGDPREYRNWGSQLKETKDYQLARERALELGAKLPSRINFVVE